MQCRLMLITIVDIAPKRKHSPLALSTTATCDDFTADTRAPARLFWDLVGIHDALGIETIPGLSNAEGKGETVPIESET